MPEPHTSTLIAGAVVGGSVGLTGTFFGAQADAIMAGTAPPADSTARFAEIKTQIEAARTRYAAILAAQTPDQLNAL